MIEIAITTIDLIRYGNALAVVAKRAGEFAPATAREAPPPFGACETGMNDRLP